jgi:hypothetical protein
MRRAFPDRRNRLIMVAVNAFAVPIAISKREKVFAFSPERCSPSQWNAVRNHNGIAFAFDRIPVVSTDRAYRCRL